MATAGNVAFARKRMEKAGNAALATSAGEEAKKKKKKRELQRHETAGVAGSSAVNQLKQGNKEASIQAIEEKTAPVDTTEDVEEAPEDKKPSAVQRVEPNEVKTAAVDTMENAEEAEDKKPAAEQRSTQPQKTKLQGHIVSSQEAILFAKKAGNNNEALDDN